MIEEQDYDWVIRHRSDGFENYTPVQLKELVPDSLIPGQKFTADEASEAEIRKLRKYTDSSDLVVAFYLNRNAHFGSIQRPDLKLGGLWALGAAAKDSSSWLLTGDFLASDCAIHEYRLLDQAHEYYSPAEGPFDAEFVVEVVGEFGEEA